MKTNPLRWSLHWQILTALLLALLFGRGLLPNINPATAATIEQICNFMGSLFMNALKMLIVPLIVASIISGVMHLGANKGVGRMSLKTFLYYSLSGAAAILVGLLLVNLIGPGRVDSETATALLGQASATAESEGLLQKVEGRDSDDLLDIFLRMFPSNIVEAATDTQSSTSGGVCVCVSGAPMMDIMS